MISRPPFDLISREELNETFLKDEKILKEFMDACIFIDALGKSLGVPRRTIATARFYFYRFFLRRPELTRYPPKDVAMCALLISGKAEETFNSIKKIIYAALSLLDTGTVKEIPSEQLNNWRQVIVGYEADMLQALGFNFCPPEYYPPLIRLVGMMGEGPDVINTSLQLLDLLTMHPLILRYPPYYVISAAVLGARDKLGRRKKPLPPPLYQYVDTSIVTEILSFIEKK
jgi:Cyclin, N-terminal domain